MTSVFGASTTYADLVAAVRGELKRSKFYDPDGNDITSSAVNMFVSAGLRSLQRLLPVRDAETSVTLTVGPGLGPTGAYPYPVGNLDPPYRWTEAIWNASSATPPVQQGGSLVRYLTYRQFRDTYPIGSVGPTSAQPWPLTGYCLSDGVLWLGPDPTNQPATIIWAYMSWLPDLIADTDTNWYTENADMALLYAACREAAVWLHEPDLTAFYEDKAGKAFNEVRGSVVRQEETGEGELVVSLYG
jgi:hypothetical protein